MLMTEIMNGLGSYFGAMKKYTLFATTLFVAFMQSANAQQYRNTLVLEIAGFVVPGCSNPLPPGWAWYDAEVYTYQHSDVHLGFISSLGYDYLILKGRFAVGAAVKCRKYFALQSVQLDYGVHVGWNF